MSIPPNHSPGPLDSSDALAYTEDHASAHTPMPVPEMKCGVVSQDARLTGGGIAQCRSAESWEKVL